VVGVLVDDVRGELLEVAADVHGLVRPQGAREDPHERLPADERVGGGAHDLGDERAVRVAPDLAERRPGRGVDGGDRRVDR